MRDIPQIRFNIVEEMEKSRTRPLAVAGLKNVETVAVQLQLS